MKRMSVFIVLGVLGLCDAIAYGQQQTGPLYSQVIPVGTSPMGIAMVRSFSSTGLVTHYIAVVANAGSASVTALDMTGGEAAVSVSASKTIPGIPSPYAVEVCDGTNQFLVSSPSDGSVTLIQEPDGTVLGKVATGSQPKAVACKLTRGVVSNTGDDTLTILDLASLSVLARISGVPGASGLHGIAIYTDSQTNTSYAWVGGTSANVITVVNLTTFAVVGRIPFNAPTAVRCCAFDVASQQDGTVVFFDPVTFNPIQTDMSGLTAPSDFILSRYGYLAAQPSVNTVTRRLNSGAVSNIAVPTATGLATEVGEGTATTGLLVAVTSPSTNSVYLIQLAPSTPQQFSAANGASFSSTGTAPGSLASAFASTGTSTNFYASGLPLPTTLGNISLRIGGSLQLTGSTYSYSATGSTVAPLLFAGPTQVNYQVPPGVAAGDSVAAQLTKADGSTLLTTLRITATTPGIFSVSQNGQGQGAVLNQDYSQNGNPQALVGAKPATRGSVIQIYATGQGATNPTLDPGAPAPTNGNLVLTVAQPTVTIGGKNAVVQFSGLAPGFVGLWQINAVVPPDVTPGNAVTLSVAAGGQASNTVTIAVQ